LEEPSLTGSGMKEPDPDEDMALQGRLREWGRFEFYLLVRSAE